MKIKPINMASGIFAVSMGAVALHLLMTDAHWHTWGSFALAVVSGLHMGDDDAE